MCGLVLHRVFITLTFSYFISLFSFICLSIHPSSLFHPAYLLTAYRSAGYSLTNSLACLFISHLRYNFDPLSIGIPRCAIADLKGKNSIPLNSQLFHHLNRPKLYFIQFFPISFESKYLLFSHTLLIRTPRIVLYILTPYFYEGGDADENAQALRDVLAGGEYTNAKRDSILLNAGKFCTCLNTMISLQYAIRTVSTVCTVQPASYST